MIKVLLPDGGIATFPDATPEDEIAQAIRDYLDAAAPPPTATESVGTESVGTEVECSPAFNLATESPSPESTAVDHAGRHYQPPEPSAPEPEPLVVAPIPGFRIEPYKADEDGELGDLITRLPVQAPA